MLKVGFIGCGNAAIYLDEDPLKRHFYSHFKPLKILEGKFVIKAAYDPSPDSLSYFCDAAKINPCKSLQDFTRQDLDVVVVTTPTLNHLESIESIKYSTAKVIVCEKPLGLNRYQASQILGIAKEFNKKLYVNYPRRYDVFYENVLNLIHSDALGPLISMIGYTDNSLLMNASHMIDILLWFGGRPLDVKGHLDRQNPPRLVHGELDHGGYALIKHDSGCTSFMKAANTSREKHMFELDLHFEGGRVRLLDDDKSTEQYEWLPSDQHTGMQELKLVKKEFNVDTSQRMIRFYDEIFSNINNPMQDLDPLLDVNFVIDEIYG